jgi:Leucine-rich repeat (LRR) protein
MSSFNIEEYLNSLPEDIEIIDISHKDITYIPSLTRFTKLELLICNYNKLTSLPELSSSLRILNCSYNQLTCLPYLNSSLIILNCNYNKLTSLPDLNSSLMILNCHDNQLTSLPKLNSSLEELYCSYNQLPFKLNCCGFLQNEKRNKLNQYIKCLERFKELYHTLKFKRQFRDWLWIKVRLLKIQNQFHPDKLEEMLTGANEEDLDEKLNKW